MAVRTFAPGDADACAALITAAIQTMDGLNVAARRLIAARNTPEGLRAELSTGHAIVLVGETGPLGLGMLQGAELMRLYVRPDAQGRGVGRRLVGALEAEARKRGLHLVESWVDSTMPWPRGSPPRPIRSGRGGKPLVDSPGSSDSTR